MLSRPEGNWNNANLLFITLPLLCHFSLLSFTIVKIINFCSVAAFTLYFRLIDNITSAFQYGLCSNCHCEVNTVTTALVSFSSQ